MNVSLKTIDTTRGILKLEIEKADYIDLVEKNLKGVRKQANIPGFRKGMVPMSMIRKLYWKHVLIEEVNKLVSDNLYKYIQKNNLPVVGEPLPNETEQVPYDFDRDENFEFCYDVAFAPKFDVTVGKDDHITYYQVNIDDEMINQQVNGYRSHYGTYEKEEEIVDDKDIIRGRVAELENGEPKEGGVVVEGGLTMPMYLKDEEEKAKFMGAKLNTVVVFNPMKAYGDAKGVASMLRIDDKTAAGLTGDFSFEIQEISRRHDAEVDQALFDKVFGEGQVTSEEEFRQRIKDALAEQFTPQSDFKFLLDVRDMLIQRAGEMKFADDLLKRWILALNNQMTAEKVEEDYPRMLQDLKYQLIKNKMFAEHNISVTEEDMMTFAKRVAKAQFAQYGMLAVTEEVLENYAKDMLKNKQTRQSVHERALEEKLAEWLKEQVTMEVKELSSDEFSKLFE